MKEEKFPDPGKSPHWWGVQAGWKRSFRPLEESTATGLQKAKWRVTCTDGWYCLPSLLSLRHSSTSAGGVWVLKLRLKKSDPGRGLGWAAWRQPKEAGVWQIRVNSEEA